MVQQIYENKYGYITLISVLVVSAVGLAIALTLLLLGISSTETSLAFEQSNQAKALANTCAEIALGNLKNNFNYAGDEYFILGQGYCYIASISVNGNQRAINTSGVIENVIRQLEIAVEGQGGLQIISWQEIAGGSIIPQSWWDDLWAKRKEINIKNITSAALIDFPAYIKVSYETEMQADYKDLRFINGSCAVAGTLELDYEIESHSLSEANIWLRVPSLEIGDNKICMYYENNSAMPVENISGVWDSGYVSVYHLDHISGNAIDAIGNFDAEEFIDPDTNMDIVGVVGRGDMLDGNDYLGSNPEWDVDGAHMYCAWVNFTALHNGTILEDGGNTDGHGLGVLSSGQFRYAEQYNGTDLYLDSANSYADGSWHYVCGGHNGLSQLLYIDGNLEQSVPQGDGLTGTNNARIGSGNGQNPVFGDNNSYYLNAALDEIRVSSIDRSAEWIKQSYEIVADQKNIATFGSEESQ